MATTPQRWWRRHPILSAALLGGAFGFLNTIAIEIGGVYRHDRHAGVLSFGPGSPFGPGINESSLLATGAVLFIEFVANVLVFAALFAAPVAIFVGIRHIVANRRPTGK